MWVRDDELCLIVERAREAGYFADLERDCWKKSIRDQLRRRVLELVGGEDEKHRVRIFGKVHDRYPEGKVIIGDAEKVAGSFELERVDVERKVTREG